MKNEITKEQIQEKWRAYGRAKKELGCWGESKLDEHLERCSWRILVKNLKIKGGEIDRVYFKKDEALEKSSFCICEIKTSYFYQWKELQDLYTEVGVKRFLKQRQIRNLFVYSEHLRAHYSEMSISKVEFHIRLFVIFRSRFKISPQRLALLPFSPAMKMSFIGENYVIFSLEPEVTSIKARKSLLQILL
jgi:Holliday junction resolvase-like predicted endonuclease